MSYKTLPLTTILYVYVVIHTMNCTKLVERAAFGLQSHANGMVLCRHYITKSNRAFRQGLKLYHRES